MQSRHVSLLPVLALLAASSLRAEERLLVDHMAVLPVSEIRVQFVVTNEGSALQTVHYSGKIRGTLHGGSDRSDNIDLFREEPGLVRAPGQVLQDTDCSVQPGGFTRAHYSFVLPPGYLGPVVLDVPDHSSEPAMISVQTGVPSHMPAVASQKIEASKAEPQGVSAGLPPTTQSSSPQAQEGVEAAAEEGAREAVLRRASQVLPGVSANEPVYFGLGASGGLNAKFQISLKYNPIGVIPAYMGFTQTSIWDLHGESKPFKDSSYRPSLFLLKDRFWTLGDKVLVLGLQTGFEHESNGKGGLDSRSINILFFRPRMTWILHKDLKGNTNKVLRLVVSPKAYTYIEKSENPDIADYRGYVDLYMALHYNDWKLSTILRKGTRAHYGSIQVDAVFPMRETERFFSRFGVHGVNGYWFAQYFNGWGESIIDYRNKQQAQFRTGIMVVP